MSRYERVGRVPRVGDCRVDPGSPFKHRHTQCLEPRLCLRRRLHDPSALVSDARERVETGYGVVERLRTQHDCERVHVTLLVKHAKVVSQCPSQNAERPSCCGDLLLEQ